MKFIVRRSNLLRELLLLKQVANQKASIPVLSYVLVEVKNNQLHLSATDLEFALRSPRCEVQVLEEGRCTLHAQTLHDLTNAQADVDITFTLGDAKMVMVSERFKTNLPTMPVAEFPAIPEAGRWGSHWAAEGQSPGPVAPVGAAGPPGDGQPLPSPSLALPRAVLREAVRKVFTSPGYVGRHYMSGALLEFTGDEFRIVSSDSHRMAVVKMPHTGAPAKVLIPQKTIDELALLLEEGDDEVTYQQEDNHVFFTIDGRTLVSRIISGEFPNYERIVDRNHSHSVTFEREKLIAAVSRCAIVADQSKALTLEMAGGRVLIKSAGLNGHAEETLLVDDAVTDTVYFNTKHLLDFLNSVSTDTVTMWFTDGMNPAFMKQEEVDGYDYTYVLVPMRS